MLRVPVTSWSCARLELGWWILRLTHDTSWTHCRHFHPWPSEQSCKAILGHALWCSLVFRSIDEWDCLFDVTWQFFRARQYSIRGAEGCHCFVSIPPYNRGLADWPNPKIPISCGLHGRYSGSHHWSPCSSDPMEIESGIILGPAGGCRTTDLVWWPRKLW